jgi:hypothetical protein
VTDLPYNNAATMSPKVQLRLEIPRHAKMLAARDFPEFFRNLTNDEIYECQQIFEAVTGREIYVMRGHPADWNEFRRIMLATDRAVHSMNYAFQFLNVSFEPGGRALQFVNLDLLEQWVKTGLAESADRALAEVLRRVIETIMQAHVFGDAEYPKPLVVRDLFRVLFIRPPEDFLPREKFDAFISYKTRVYAGAAAQLRDDLKREGLNPWLDRDQIAKEPGEWLDPSFIKAYLRSALQASKLTVFFETYAAATADENFRGNHIAFNWQIFERRHARDIVYVRPPTRTIDFDNGRPSVGYGDVADLAKKVAVLARGLPERKDQSPERDPVVTDGTVRELHEARTRLHRQLRERFGRPVELSARMTLALLAPETTDEMFAHHSGMGDDVLVHLLRYSPFAATLLRNAGLDLARLLAVGVKFAETFWSPPGNFRVKDVFDSRPDGNNPNAIRRAVEAGELDEAALFAGIAGMARENSYPRDLIVRTLKYMGGGSGGEEMADDLVRDLRREVFHAAENGGLPSPRQHWVLFLEAGKPCFRPFAAGGNYRVPGIAPPHDHVSVCLTHTHSIFDLHRLMRIEELLPGGAAQQIDRRIAAYPCIDFILDDVDRLCPATILFPGFGDGSKASFSEVFMLAGDGIAPAAAEHNAQPGKERSHGSFLRRAYDLLEKQTVEDQSGQNNSQATLLPNALHSSGWQARRAVILGAAPVSAVEKPDSLKAYTPFDLQCQVLAPLKEFHTMSVLDYDSY